MTKRYSLININTGKIVRGAKTRAEARMIKRERNFNVRIYDNMRETIVR